jgi:tyrosyl-tRNA synthetase
MSLAKEIQDRGFIHQIAGPSLELIINDEKRVIYHGIDPSADSAHAGNMVIWMLLRHLAQAGHPIVFLVGGGTGMIGDPKPDAERQLKDETVVQENVAKLKEQAERFFRGYTIEFVDNNEWLGELKLIDFLRDIGKHYTVNELIKKDAIATRLASDTGLSYTEFAYPLLQGYDYLRLFETKDCTVQVGGSDQWGNIVSGVELVRRKKQEEVYAITVPLIVDKATGKKFGKSEGNAVWLDPEKTSPYQFYQFWLNASDESVIDYLKLFTFLPLQKIIDIEKEFQIDPSTRLAQKTLAFSVTEVVHGTETATAAETISGILFGGQPLTTLSETERAMLLANAPVCRLKETNSLIDVLVLSNLASSKREARTFIESGAVSVAEQKIKDINLVIDPEEFRGGLLVLRRGKKQLCILSAGN